MHTTSFYKISIMEFNTKCLRMNAKQERSNSRGVPSRVASGLPDVELVVVNLLQQCVKEATGIEIPFRRDLEIVLLHG